MKMFQKLVMVLALMTCMGLPVTVLAGDPGETGSYNFV